MSELGFDKQKISTPLLALRLVTLTVLVILMTVHVRSLRVFRWEQSVSGGVVLTFCIAELGLSLCAGAENCGGGALQAFLCCAGGALLAINAAVIWYRWQRSGQLTLVVAELLDALGVPLRMQVMGKAALSLAASIGLIIDLACSPFLTGREQL